jgi:Domain of unknown function (DUF5916)
LLTLLLALQLLSPPPAPSLRSATLPSNIQLDGHLNEPAWAAAPEIDDFTQVEPEEGATPSARTTVRVLAHATAIVFGITSDDPDPSSLVSFSVRRDADLEDEDHVRIVLGPFVDGRSGYVFAVNPSGARYDALIDPGGDDEVSDWDAIWEASTTRGENGWTAEIRIPIQSLSFKPGAREWDFNVERRVQRLQETNRWASPQRQYELTQTSRAGRLTGLPDFALGRGLSVRPALTSGGGRPAAGASLEGTFHPSVDVTKRIGSNLLTSLTVNTDFAETEVDTRRTNLTRFPLFFPEKRTFFLEGTDLFSFGLGLEEDVIPFFSRRIGLVDGTEIPIIAGTKINGRIADTNVGGLVAVTGHKQGVVDERAVMGVSRVKQNIGDESWLGAIVGVGDPQGRHGSWTAGADFTYSTSNFRGDKNLRAGVWGLATARDDLRAGVDDRSAAGFTVEYPNDEWEFELSGKRIGREFDPSLGFVPRSAVVLYEAEASNRIRPNGRLQQMTHEIRSSIAADLSGRWESYEVSLTPLNWRFSSGDRVEFAAEPTGERLEMPFEVEDDVLIAPGSYRWMRYSVEVTTAQKRRFQTQASWSFGGFYDGTLDQIEVSGVWNPVSLVTLELEAERNMVDLPAGDFEVSLVSSRLRVNVSPDLSLASYVQYDTDSNSIGVNTRLRWTFRPVADLFVVYNHNVRSILDRWQQESNELIVKVQYAWRW